LAPLEGPATIPGYGGGPAEAERAKPALPGAPPQPETVRARGSCEDREGHPYKIFFRAPVIAPAAMRSSSEPPGPRSRGIVPTLVAVLWNGFWSERGAGESDSPPGDEPC